MNRTAAARATLCILLLATVACGDARLKGLSEGIDRDSVAAVMAAGAPDYQESYLSGGQFWEVFYYTAPGKAPDTLALRAMSPVVLTDGKVAGWGWSFLEETAATNGFQLQPKR